MSKFCLLPGNTLELSSTLIFNVLYSKGTPTGTLWQIDFSEFNLDAKYQALNIASMVSSHQMHYWHLPHSQFRNSRGGVSSFSRFILFVWSEVKYFKKPVPVPVVVHKTEKIPVPVKRHHFRSFDVFADVALHQTLQDKVREGANPGAKPPSHRLPHQEGQLK